MDRKLIAAAKQYFQLEKMSGPGVVYNVKDMPLGSMLRFIIQSGRTVETDLAIGDFRSTLAIIHNEVRLADHPGLRGWFPRPQGVIDVEEMAEVFKQLKEIADDLRGHLPA